MWRRALMLSLALAFAGAVAPLVHAQETAIKHAPRGEMIDAIMAYAGSGGCGTLRKVFGTLFDEACSKPGAGTAVVIRALAYLRSQPDRALAEICTKNKLADCDSRQEVSTGRPILAFDTSFSVNALASIGAWSPDGHRLVIYDVGQPKGKTRLVDVQRRQLGPVIAEGAAPSAAAWSPDGKYVALAGHQAVPGGPVAVRLYDSETVEERGSLPIGKQNQCGLVFSKQLAFTPDSKGLWVNCGGTDWGAPAAHAIAIKLKIPGLEIEDRLPLESDAKARFVTYAISRWKGDLILTGLSRPAASGDKATMSAHSFSLLTKAPLHPPVLMPSTTSISNVLLADDQRGVLVLYDLDVAELWSTAGKGQLDDGYRDEMLDDYAPQNRIAAAGLHVRVRYIPNSLRRMLVVRDSRSGDTVQEIGPLQGAGRILVSPNGSRLAVSTAGGIRFYRVRPDAISDAPSTRDR